MGLSPLILLRPITICMYHVSNTCLMFNLFEVKDNTGGEACVHLRCQDFCLAMWKF